MPDSTFILALTGFAFVLAGFVKGVLGQGLPTVAVGVLSLIMSPGEAAALVVVPALITNIWQAWFGPSLMPLIRRLWPTLLASFLGTFVATWAGLGLLTPEAAAMARKVLGVALMIYGILGVSRVRLQVPAWMEFWLGPVMGTANGAVSTATGVFMFPVIPYIQSLGARPRRPGAGAGHLVHGVYFRADAGRARQRHVERHQRHRIVRRHGDHLRRHVHRAIPSPVRPA